MLQVYRSLVGKFQLPESTLRLFWIDPGKSGKGGEAGRPLLPPFPASFWPNRKSLSAGKKAAGCWEISSLTFG